MSRQEGARPDLMGEIRFRIPLPVAIPTAALVLIGAYTFGFSRVLLEVDREIAVVLAIVAAANLLAGAAVVSLRERMGGAEVVELLVVVTYPILIGAIIAAVGIGATESAEPEPAKAGGAPAGELMVSAQNIAFDTAEITLPAKEQVTITFENQDAGINHNVAVYETEAAEEEIFVGDIFTGVATKEYTFTAPAPGKYFFRCDVHPDSMTGQVVVEKAAST